VIQRLKAVYLREQFTPAGQGALVNPYFIIRRGLVRTLRRLAPKVGGRLLDFGCGTKPYESLFNVEEYVGVDIRDRASRDHEGGPVDVFYDGHRLPFDDGSFDTVFSSETLEHIFNVDEVLTELNRVLRSGGQLLMTAPFVWCEHEMPYDFGRYTSVGLRHILEEHGFEVIQSEKTTGWIETVTQMWNAYLVETLIPANRWVRLFTSVMLIAPFTLTGLLLGALLPNNSQFFHGNVVLACKVGSPRRLLARASAST